MLLSCPDVCPAQDIRDLVILFSSYLSIWPFWYCPFFPICYSKIILFPLHPVVASYPCAFSTDSMVEFSFVILKCPVFLGGCISWPCPCIPFFANIFWFITSSYTFWLVCCFFFLVFSSLLFFSFSFLLILIIIDHLAETRWSACISKSQRSLSVLLPRTNAGLCIYHLFVWSNFNFWPNSL